METKIKDLVEFLTQFDQETPVFRINSVGLGDYLDLDELYLGKVDKNIDKLGRSWIKGYKEHSYGKINGLIIDG